MLIWGLPGDADGINSFSSAFFEPTDFKVTSGNFSFHVHKEVLKEKSEFFNALCSSSFKEAKANEVALDHRDPATVARMLCAMYFDTYPVCSRDPVHGGLELTLKQVLKLARFEKKGDEIRSLVKREMEDVEETAVHVQMLAMVDEYMYLELRDRAVWEIVTHVEYGGRQSLWAVLDFIKDTGIDTSQLQERLCTYVVRNFERIVNDESFEALPADLPLFAAKVFKGLAAWKTELEDGLRQQPKAFRALGHYFRTEREAPKCKARGGVTKPKSRRRR